jgi:cell wall-associated NlpC family hydrolase
MSTDFTDLIGAPFRWGGRDRSTGIDCWGVCLEGLQRLGIPFQEDWAYNEEDARSVVRAARDCASRLERIEEQQAQPGDIAIMDSRHTGLVTDEGILHTCERFGCCLQSFDQLRVLYSKIEVYRWPG